MTLLAPLIPFVCWIIWIEQFDRAANPDFARLHLGGAVVFLGGYALLVGGMALWGRLLARRISIANLELSLRRFNRMILWARLWVVAWFIGAMFGGLHWGETVLWMLGPLRDSPVQLPGALLATFPAFAAWAGLWWAQYPADRALREQTLLLRLESDLPVHAPPGLWKSFIANLRLRVLFVVVPVLMVLGARDLVMLSLRGSGVRVSSGVEELLLLGAALMVFAAAPEILRFVLHTHSMPRDELRARLERLCKENRLRYRDILIWNTDHSVGNAAVMGVLPIFRYVLLSDLLIATMTDEQIEAVFAHEAGHIKNRHMAWYVVLIITMLVGLSGPIDWLESRLVQWMPHWMTLDYAAIIVETIIVGLFILLFGAISRRFERQADVYAARWMQQSVSRPFHAASPQVAELFIAAPGDAVGEYGATVFNSALQRVAAMNNIPLHARNFTHGSIAGRMRFLRYLSRNPVFTDRFEQFIQRLKLSLLAALMVGIGIAWLMRDRLV